MTESEVDRIDPQPNPVTLASGFPVEVIRLRTRQLFRLMRIITRGANPTALSSLNFADESEDGRKAFVAQLLAITVTAIPDAEQEVIGFLQSMTKPAGLVDKPAAQLTKADNDANKALNERFSKELWNPELDDFLTLLEAIIVAEAPDIQALGKKLAHLWTVTKAAASSEQPESPPEGGDLHSPDLTPGPLTS